MKWLATILVIGTILPELQGLLPDYIRDKTVSLFLKPGFHLQLALSWWIKMLFDDFNLIAIFFVLAKVSRETKLFYPALILFLYHVVDAFMLVWDFKQSYSIYWVLLVSSIIPIFIMLRKGHLKLVK
jgi:hypothetical protein